MVDQLNVCKFLYDNLSNFKNSKKENGTGRYVNDRKNDGNIKKRTFKFDTKS